MWGCCSDAESWISRLNRSTLMAGEPRFLGEEDAAHPAAAQLPLDAIRRPEGGLQAAGQLFHSGPR